MAIERTLAIVKPGEGFPDRFMALRGAMDKAKFTAQAVDCRPITEEEARHLYEVHTERPFFKDLIDYMTSDNCYMVVLEGEDAVVTWRTIIGATDPNEAEPGTLRADHGKSKERNGFHGSDSTESADFEIQVLFPGKPELLND